MSLTLMTAPASEPVSLEQARLHLRLDQTQEDTLLTSLITAARMLVESQTARALITQHWQTIAKTSAAHTLALPLSPVQAVASVFAREDGNETELAASEWRLEGDVLHFTNHGEGQQMRIMFRAGYGDDATSVPAPLRQAILQMTAHWFENRGESFSRGTAMPAAIEALLAPYKPVRL